MLKNRNYLYIMGLKNRNVLTKYLQLKNGLPTKAKTRLNKQTNMLLTIREQVEPQLSYYDTADTKSRVCFIVAGLLVPVYILLIDLDNSSVDDLSIEVVLKCLESRDTSQNYYYSHMWKQILPI